MATTNADRARRHSRRREAVEAEAERDRGQLAERAGAKGERARRILEQRMEERRRAGLRAQRMAQLREGAIM